MRILKGYRTLILNGALGAVAAVELLLPHIVEFLGMPEVRGILPAGWERWYPVLLAVLNIWLRLVTTTPVGQGSTLVVPAAEKPARRK